MEAFAVNEATGEIVLRTSLDYEKQTEHVLTLVAKDGGDEPATATSQVIVHVLDTNDNGPEISVSFADGEYNTAFVSGKFGFFGLSVCNIGLSVGPQISVSLADGEYNAAYFSGNFF